MLEASASYGFRNSISLVFLQRECNANVCVALLLRQHHFLNHTFVYKFTKRLLTNCRKDVSIKSYSWSYLIRIHYATQSQQVFSKPLAP